MEEKPEAIFDRSNLLTEKRLPESMDLDRMPILQAVELMNTQDALAVAAVAAERNSIARAIEIVTEAFRQGGRLIYIGAGTSGRLGVLDATECPPTFGVEPTMVQGIIAGGNPAMFRSAEDAEDNPDEGATAIDAITPGPNDVVMGIAAGGTTPFVCGALDRATSLGAKTIFLCCVAKTDAEPEVDLVIRPLTGPEVLTGSTRLKAGTATKLVLNQITTLSMVQLGKVYQNLMVDLRATNKKLTDRAIRIVSTLTGLSRDESAKLLTEADAEVKTAIVMHACSVDRPAARRILVSANGCLRDAILGVRS